MLQGGEEESRCWVATKRVALVVELGVAGGGKASTGQWSRGRGAPDNHQ